MPDAAWRAYLEMALGLTEAPRKRAQKVAGDLLSKGGATAGQLQGLVEDLVSTSTANREALTNLVRYEVDRALGRVGLATAEEVAELTSRLKSLEKELAAAREGGAGAPAAGSADGADVTIAEPGPAAVVPPATRAAVKKTVAKKTVAKTVAPPATAVPGQVTPAKTTPAKVTPAKATPAKTTPAKVTPATVVAEPEKAVPAKATKIAKAARRAATSTPATPSTEPAGTASAPTAPVKAAAAETELPPPAKKAAKRAPAKRTAPEDQQ